MPEANDKLKRSHARKPKTAMEVVEIIRQFFAGQENGGVSYKEAEKLWDMLTALRGPDDENFRLKDAVTVPFREAFLGEEAAIMVQQHQGAFTREHRSNKKEHLKIRETMSDGHFRGHLKKAFKAIGLDWNK